MIISASRRTDIPAFYSEWFMNRVRAGFCTVPNPFNREQVSRVSLNCSDVDVIVFWTRNPAPLIPHLDELDHYQLRYYFQFTIMDNPRSIDQKSPPVQIAVDNFKRLSDKIGPQRVIWRYDPIVFSSQLGSDYHIVRYERIAEQLRGYTGRSVISVVDRYKKASRRFAALKDQGNEILEYDGSPNPEFDSLMEQLVEIAGANHFDIYSCSETLDLGKYGIKPGKCVDDDYIHRVFGLSITPKKDPSQRKECGCVISKDIGMYDTCLFGCQYCYATSSFEAAQKNHDRHDPLSPSIIGWYEVKPNQKIHQESLFGEKFSDKS